jgi:hypothetical protein
MYRWTLMNGQLMLLYLAAMVLGFDLALLTWSIMQSHNIGGPLLIASVMVGISFKVLREAKKQAKGELRSRLPPS